MSKKILITGASSDIGSCLIDIILKNIDDPNLFLTFFTNKPDFGFECKLVKVDFTADIASFCSELKKEDIGYFIQLQGGFSGNGSIENFDMLNYLQVFDLNLFSTIKILNSIIPKMKSDNFGRIVLMNTASSNFGGGENSFLYGLSKHGVSYLTKYMAKHYSRYNIITNCVSPGFIDTKQHYMSKGYDVNALKDRISSIRIGRSGKTEDVAQLIFNLCFKNEFIIGENIKIDGADFI